MILFHLKVLMQTFCNFETNQKMSYKIIQLTKDINKGDRFILSEGKTVFKVWL